MSRQRSRRRTASTVFEDPTRSLGRRSVNRAPSESSRADKLPHDLVARFRSTRDEALEACLPLHIVDAADPGFRAQMQVTREVLDEIGAGNVRLVLNKIDKVAETDRERLSTEFPAALLVSAKDPADVGRVRDAIIGAFEASMREIGFVVPYDASRAIGEIHKLNVISESYQGDGVHYRVRASESAIERIRAMLPY